MFRFGKVTWSSSGGYAPYLDAPDAGVGGGGSTDPVDGGDGVPPSDMDIDAAADAEPAAAQPTDDDEEGEDEDLRDDGEYTPERFKRVASKLKKQTRRVQKLTAREREHEPLRAQLAELREQGISLDDLKYGFRQHRELAAQIASNPTLRKLVEGDEAVETREEPSRAAVDDDPDFDESALPFDPNESPINKYFRDLAKQNHDLSRAARKLEDRLNQIEGKETSREMAQRQVAEREERTTWKSAIDAAADTLADDMTRTLFKDAMTAAYHGRGKHQQTPQQIIAHYLKGNVAPGQAKAANAAAAKAAPVRTAATQQRIAEQNKTLPRTVAPAGSPASARTGKETLTSVRKRITGSNAKW